MSDLTFSVQGQSSSATKFTAKARQFSLVIDEPEALGGKDESANPVEFILAGLAGCLNVVGHLVAKELQLDIKISGEINPNRFLGISKDERAGFKSINVSLKPEATTDDVTLEKWLDLVQERCPVKDNLLNQTPLKLKLEQLIYN
jgi:uncharacterized OsmC-like protein